MVYTLLAIALGASSGAIIRWFVSLKLNAVYSTIPLGTLSVNLIGGYLIGIAVAYFIQNPLVPEEYRALVLTGFLGGLTTFSTFSIEVVTLLQQSRAMGAMMVVIAHTMGSVIMTFLGLLTYMYILNR